MSETGRKKRDERRKERENERKNEKGKERMSAQKKKEVG